MRPQIKYLIFFLIYAGTVYAQEGKLSVKLSLEKDVYYEGETITVRVKFFNNDTADHFITGDCSLENSIILDLHFINTLGYPIQRTDYQILINCAPDMIKISKGDSYESFGASIILNGLYKIGMFGYLPAGDYSVYYDDQKYGISDTTKIKVLSLENIQSYSEQQRIRHITNDLERFNEWREYLYNEESFIFMNYAFDELIKLQKFYNYYKNSDNLRYRDIIHYFGKNPDAWSTDIYLFFSSFYIKKILGEAKMNEMLQHLSQKYPDTRVSYTANKILNEKKIPEYVY